ncbi:hypothetical protein G6O67_007126 [Ophiocordyceps sinensis]|uniref:Uncharacterized protein n=2 Tax=Ophiocordyceps sinensis TaxID=72228 RepID=A0A8H4LUH1_9HYPO|nr:hypothetical protein OCS_03337 [Ophiocordyceps sinensis CO18]KAF4505146.1 hypothetical protein G6O67_007126 [Ophiocordyceps sinensis]
MSLLTSPALQCLYHEAQNHDIEYKAKNFWQNFLIQQFPITQNYLVNSEVSPDGESNTRLDLSVERVRGEYPYQIHPTLMFQEVKRKGTGELKKVEDQLRNGARRYLEKSGEEFVYGMTSWGTKARVWIIARSGNHYRMRHLYFGSDREADRSSYVDANDDYAYYISCFIAHIKEEAPPQMPESFQQGSSAA